MFPNDPTSSPAESRPAPPRAAPPRIVARPTDPRPATPAGPAEIEPRSRRAGAVSDDAASPAHPTRASAGAVDRHAPTRLQSLPSWLLSQASARAAALVDDALSADGLRRQDYRVLVAIDEAVAASQADLGRSVWLDRSDLHGVVTQLEQRDLVARERDPDDRRRNVVTLTPTGRATLTDLNARIDAAQALLLQPLSADDRAALTRILTALLGEADA